MIGIYFASHTVRILTYALDKIICQMNKCKLKKIFFKDRAIIII